MKFFRPFFVVVSACLLVSTASAQQSTARPKPKVIMLGVNGAELDIILPLIVRGDMPNLARVMENGVYGRLKTVAAPNCPKAYSVIETSTPPDENGVTGFLVGGIPANTNMLKKEPMWSLLSRNNVTVGMANVPATFPVMKVNGYMISGMMTRGKGCEDGVLCAPKISEVQGGDAVYPASLKTELMSKLGDFYIDCSRMPAARDIEGHEQEVVTSWLKQVQRIRDDQEKMFDHLLTNHPTDFTFFAQSCEDRVGHWLYPIQPFNAGYNPKVATVDVNAFPNQYRALDKVIGTILKHVDDNTYFIMVSDHGIKPLRYKEAHDAHKDHAGTTPVIAKHDFEDGDEVPGTFVIMGPGVKKGMQLKGLNVSVYDIAPTVLKLYGISAPPQMQGRVISEVFSEKAVESAARAEDAEHHH
jgi:predicted AlkP superfamily phosphohydrolase/phosphomutase